MARGDQAPSQTSRRAPFVPDDFEEMQAAEHGRNPICLLVTAKAEQDLCEDRTDQGGAVIVQQLVHCLLFSGAGAIEERPPEAGVNENQVPNRHSYPSVRRLPAPASYPPSGPGPTGPSTAG